jgi:hypothetical protein
MDTDDLFASFFSFDPNAKKLKAPEPQVKTEIKSTQEAPLVDHRREEKG